MTLFLTDLTATLAALGSISGRARDYLASLPEAIILGLLGGGLVATAVSVRQSSIRQKLRLAPQTILK